MMVMYIIDKEKDFGIPSLITGILSMFLWLIPLAGFFSGIISIVLGYISLKAENNGAAVSGLILGSLGLILTFLRSGLVFYYG